MRAGLPFLLLLPLAACKGDDTDDTTDWECDATHDAWERCTDEDAVEWCHGDMDPPHFHEGTDCADLGYECTEYGEGLAACVDTSTSCDEGEAWCEDNTAYFCVDGSVAVEPCSSVQTCHAHDDEAHCEDDVAFDPQQACDILADGPFEDKDVTPTFSSVFHEDYHADLATAVSVDLPDQAVSYIHFPVTHDSEYVVFLDTAGVLQAILDNEQNDQGASSGGPNGKCKADLVDHWHAELHNHTGSTVPFVLEFAAVDEQPVTLIVMDKGAE